MVKFTSDAKFTLPSFHIEQTFLFTLCQEHKEPNQKDTSMVKLFKGDKEKERKHKGTEDNKTRKQKERNEHEKKADRSQWVSINVMCHQGWRSTSLSWMVIFAGSTKFTHPRPHIVL